MLFSKMNAGVPANIPSMHSNDYQEISGRIEHEQIPAIAYDEEEWL